MEKAYSRKSEVSQKKKANLRLILRFSPGLGTFKQGTLCVYSVHVSITNACIERTHKFLIRMLSKGPSKRINFQIFEIMSKTPEFKKIMIGTNKWAQKLHTQKNFGPIFKIVFLKLGELTQGTFRH